MAKATIEGLAFPRRSWREPGSAGRRGCLSFSGSEFRSRLQERRGNGVKNLKGSAAIPDISFLTHTEWKRINELNRNLFPG
ncbi:MAG: hypothetical protein WCC06_04535 [Candidatus Aminicenantales bacterium]